MKRVFSFAKAALVATQPVTDAKNIKEFPINDDQKDQPKCC